MYRIIREGRMRERSADPMKFTKYITGIRSMLDEMEECLEDMDGSFGERDDYEHDYGERRSARTGRYMR